MTINGETVAAFLNSFKGRPFVWGVDDCSAVFALWLKQNGIIVNLPFYTTQEQAHTLIERHGGLIPTWDSILAPTTVVERSGAPRLGDIAVIETRLHGDVGVMVGGEHLCAWRVSRGGFTWISPRSYRKVWAVNNEEA